MNARTDTTAALSPHNAAWLAGEISALQSLAWQYADDIRHHRLHALTSRPISAEYHRRQMIAAYLKLREVRGK